MRILFVYSPDGSRLASGGGDMAVRFWNVTSSMPMHTCTGKGNVFFTFKYHGQRLTTIILLGHKNHVLCTAWSPDGTLFASADKSGMVMLSSVTMNLLLKALHIVFR